MPRATAKRAGKQAKPGSRFPDEVLAANVRDYRKLRGLSQEQLAERMAALGHGWTAGIVGFVERGDRNVTVNELAGAALVLGVPPGHLLSPYGVDGHERSGLDVGLEVPLSFGEAYAWLDQTVVAELVWAPDGPQDVRYLPKRGDAVMGDEDIEAGTRGGVLADTLNASRRAASAASPKKKTRRSK